VLPEITRVVKGFLDRLAPEPLPDLGLKDVSGAGFGTWDASWYERNGYPNVAAALGAGSSSWSGESVSIPAAMNHSVVWACYRLISETVGMLPCVMLQSTGSDKRVASEHPAYTLLHDAPSDDMTAMSYRSTETGHCVLGGNAYSMINRRSGTGTAIGLDPIDPEQVTPDREKNTSAKRLIYVVKEGNSQSKTYTVQPGKPHDILHLRGIGWDGIKGFSVITMARQSIGTAISAERNVGAFYRAGGRLPYVIEQAIPWKTDSDRDKWRADWERIYSQPHRAPMMSPGQTYKQIGLSMLDQQMLETRLFSIHEICRWFLVSPHLVGDLSRATFSNIEQLALEFVKMTLSTWLTRWEQELWRCVLTPEEKSKGYFFKHNLTALLRGDFASRMAGYSTMLQNGIASVNEVRDLEDWNPTEGGDDHHIQLNMQSLPGGTPLTSQAAALVRLGNS